jgi:hypothetical protein
MSTSSKVTIRPYVENVSNMGLEKHKQVLFDGAKYTIEMAAKEEGDTVRYLTGINPFAPEIEFLPQDEKEAKVNEIKKIIIAAEAKLAGVSIKSEDPNWWDKVKKVRPDNIAFWSSNDMKLVLTNEETPLDTKVMTDLLILTSIKAGGFPEIAVSLTDARSRVKAPKFYLDELEETAYIETEGLKLRDEAGGLLRQMYSKMPNKLMYVCKVIDSMSIQYKKSTPLDVMYLNMSRYLDGETLEKNKIKAAKAFIDAAELDMETLKLRALIKDATFYKILSLKGDGMIYDMDSNTAMGKNPTALVEFLKNPLNEETLKRLLNKVEVYWKA